MWFYFLIEVKYPSFLPSLSPIMFVIQAYLDCLQTKLFGDKTQANASTGLCSLLLCHCKTTIAQYSQSFLQLTFIFFFKKASPSIKIATLDKNTSHRNKYFICLLSIIRWYVYSSIFRKTVVFKSWQIISFSSSQANKLEITWRYYNNLGLFFLLPFSSLYSSFLNPKKQISLTWYFRKV